MDSVPTSDAPADVTVLLVDDEQNILQSLQRIMRRETFRIVTAGSGDDALALLAKLSRVAVIVSDQRMPGMSGAELLRRSRQHAPEAIRVLLTGHSELADAIDAVNLGGISHYLSKPWNDTELLQTVRGGVHSYLLAEENRRLQELVTRQNRELQDWNRNLKDRVMQQTGAIRIKNEELQQAIRHQKESYRQMISSLASLVEMRGERNRRHAEHVSKLALLAAQELGLTKEEQETVHTAALLHDVGEIGIGERVLLRAPESMGADDYHEYCQHPVRAQLLIDPIEELRPAGVLIRHHHERFDGAGFPDGLAGERIPLGARILAYADLIDRFARQYASAITDQALQQTDIQLGKMLDPALRATFHAVTKYVYLPKPGLASTLDAAEREVRLQDLDTGMMLTRNVYSGSGMLLLQQGVTLDIRAIEALQRYRMLDPARDDVIHVRKAGRIPVQG